MDVPYYPINDFGPVMKGMVIGGLGIFHVFLAQFAIGGGMLMCYFQRLAMTGRLPEARTFLDGFFRVLVLISFVLGALTGVAMWFTTIQISPRTIGLMVDAFHWVWATEWTFFCLEIIAGYAFYRYGTRLDDRTRLLLLGLYATAAWFSLFWINGILSWQLTPGGWLADRSVWAGFFNPSFLPSLGFRTVVAMAIAGLAACVIANLQPGLDRAARRALISRAAHFLLPMALMPLLGLWYFAVIPPDSRAWVLGGSVAMTMFMALAVGASVLIGGYALIGLWRQRLYINGATATLLCALAFAATAGGEFVREGIRKPYTVRHTLLSNAIKPHEIAYLRRVGSVARDPYPLKDARRYPNPQLALGAKVFRFQCGICHTYAGANGLVHLAGSWTTEQKRMNIAKLQYTKPFMPPFAGTPEELEALVQLINWLEEGQPVNWPVSDDAAARERIAAWLEEAGTQPAQAEQRQPEAVDDLAQAQPPHKARKIVSPHGRPAMNSVFPFGFAWPTAFYLVLYLVTLIVHVGFMNYVLAGTGYLALMTTLRPAGSASSRLTALLRDWLPFALGAAITAGVAPLLFIQILYQEPFYTANLLLSHRWMAILPVLIVGFYLLYLWKSHAAAQWSVTARAGLGLAAFACFAFTAYSWTENHLLSTQGRQAWTHFYASGDSVYRHPQLLPRLSVWFVGALPTMCVLAAWQLRASQPAPDDNAREVRHVAHLALGGLIAVGACGLLFYASVDSAARGQFTGRLAGPYFALALLGYIVQGGAWVWLRGAGAWQRLPLLVATFGLLMVLTGMTVLREALRLSALDITRFETHHREAAEVGGLGVFLLFFALNAILIAYVVIRVRKGLARPE